MSDCVFCRIVNHTLPSKIVHEDELVLAFEDVNPQAPVHVLIIPKRHVRSVEELGKADSGLLGHLVLTCSKVAREKGIAQSGYRLVANTGFDGGQTVFHLHLHLLGGRRMTWPPG